MRPLSGTGRAGIVPAPGAPTRPLCAGDTRQGLRLQRPASSLKRMVRAWLKHHPDVLAFCEAGETMGGAGALLVLLRREHAP
ncbi:Smr/MutS family protein [Chromobacterium haemolyticum]|nr:Smr/MutS family protein [Chromobacterium haemolyticum]